jgi:hypothetical protein
MKVPPPLAWTHSYPATPTHDMGRPQLGFDPFLAAGGMPSGPQGAPFDTQRKGRKPQSTNKPPAPAKSVATASRAFFKGLKRAVQEASNLALTANLAQNAPGSHTCQVGIAVLAVGHGLTDNKNGRVSKEEEQRAARRKPQAFLLQDGQIPPATMQKIFRSAMEGAREGSPPAEITVWHGMEQMDKWFARREAERSAIPHPNGGSRSSCGDLGEGSASDARLQPGGLQQGAWQQGPGGWYPPEDARTKCPADISKWLREECQAGLDEEDISKLMHCLTHPDWGIKNKEFLFALSDEDLKTMMAPIREQGLKNFIIQKCRKFRPRDMAPADGPAPKWRKTNAGGKAVDLGHGHGHV